MFTDVILLILFLFLFFSMNKRGVNSVILISGAVFMRKWLSSQPFR